MTRHLDRLREAVVEALEVIPRVSCMFWIACQRLVSVDALACHATRYPLRAHHTTQADASEKLSLAAVSAPDLVSRLDGPAHREHVAV